MAQVLVMLWLVLKVFAAFAMHGEPYTLKTHDMYLELMYAASIFMVLYLGGLWDVKK